MLPSKVRTLFAEVVTNHRREHQSKRDKAVQEFTFKMARQGISQSSAFNDGKVKIYCEAFEKYADGVWDDMQTVLAGGFEFYPGCEDDLINFLKESLAAVYEADTKSLFAVKHDVHTPTARHLARCKPRFEFCCQAVTEKLTTEIKISVNQLRATKEMEAALVTIEGHKRQVTGFDEQRNLVLADGKRYTFERLNYKPSGQPPDEPDGDIFGWPLLEVVKLQKWQGDWKWNDEPLTLEKWMESELQNLCDKRGIPPEQRTEQIKISALLRAKPGELHLHYMTREICYSRLKHLPDAVREQINGVAWFEHDDGAGGWNTPILLKSFRPLPASENPEKLVKELTKAIEANAEQKGKVALDKANALASLNLQEALSKWMRFDPPGMKTDTKARIEKAVKMYLTDNQKRSLAKIAKEFGVSRKTVSTWFASFTNHTGFKVVRHQRHESVADHLKAESSQENETSGGR